MKKQEDLVGLSRKPIINQLLAIKDSITKEQPHYTMDGLTEENKLRWILKNISHLGNTHYKPYMTYDDPQTNNGIFKISKKPNQEVAVALFADWASDTPESHLVAGMSGTNDITIHLGDTYYVGNLKEIEDNFDKTIGAPWPYGVLGSFAMLGNHEMYSSGKSYFEQLLPRMGLFPLSAENQQKASFFCLENDHWRIIGLDTGYYSLTGLFGIKRFYGNSCESH